jgi:hypothetical protein
LGFENFYERLALGVVPGVYLEKLCDVGVGVFVCRVEGQEFTLGHAGYEKAVQRVNFPGLLVLDGGWLGHLGQEER